MLARLALGLRARSAVRWSLVLLCGWCANLSQVLAEDCVRVEEEWELVVGEPDINSNAPQVTCTFSPLGDLSGVHAAFELNHQSQPDYAAGGLQLQLWSGEVHLQDCQNDDSAELATPGETITWTQRIRVRDHRLHFSVRDGSSTTWGEFGAEGGNLHAAVDTELNNLNGYNSAVSIANSGVGYAGNLVASLVLKRVRGYDDDGDLVFSIDAPQQVHPQE